MSRPKMIGAHAPRPPVEGKNPGRDLARQFNAAFDNHFVKKPGRTHLVYRSLGQSIR